MSVDQICSNQTILSLGFKSNQLLSRHSRDITKPHHGEIAICASRLNKQTRCKYFIAELHLYYLRRRWCHSSLPGIRRLSKASQIDARLTINKHVQRNALKGVSRAIRIAAISALSCLNHSFLSVSCSS